ncbi:MAG: hypothetical protein CSA34_05365 [Desulfobulbus propionicus]|nr:MAG: hypothetical protein CSA34_05365 [Desulfobulbus propionicus]
MRSKSTETSWPRLIVFFGLTASGKSTLARLFAERHGYLHLNTDIVRRELAGIQPGEHGQAPVEQGIYTRAFSRRTYAELLQRAEKALEAGGPGVVLDGSFLVSAQRNQVVELARAQGEQVMFIFCYCHKATVQARLRQRHQDPQAVSDGNWEVYLHQLRQFCEPEELPPEQRHQINTEKSPAELVEEVERLLTEGPARCRESPLDAS